jgi:hypothetical protein
VAFDCEERRHARLGDRQANAAQYGAVYCGGEEERADRCIGSYIVSFGFRVYAWSYSSLSAPAIQIAFALEIHSSWLAFQTAHISNLSYPTH